MQVEYLFLLFINTLFFSKFAFQTSESFVVTALSTVMYIGSSLSFLEISTFLTKKFVVTLTFAWVFCMLALCVKYPVVGVDTDRWSAITVFWDGVFQGKFPYEGRTVLGNLATSLPGLQLLCFPFYITTYYLMTIVPLIPFLISSAKEKVALFFLIGSPAIAWSIVTRDTIIINSVFFLFAMWILNKDKHNFVAGVLFGLLSCTRIAYLAPIVFLALQHKHKIISVFPGFVLGASMSFAPLLFWGTDALLKDNPMLAQAGHMPLYQEIVFFGLVVFLGVASRRLELEYSHQAFVIGIMFFVFAVIFQVNRVEFSWDSIMEKHGDISYFLLCYPFLLASLFRSERVNSGKAELILDNCLGFIR